MPGAEIRGQAQTRSFSAKHPDLETPRCLESQRYRNVHAHSRGFSTRVFSPTTHLPSATREPHAGGGQPPAPHVQTSHSPDRQGGRGSASHPPPTHTHTALRAGTRRHPTATPAAEKHLHLAGRSRARPLPPAGTPPAATGPGPAGRSERETSPTRREKPRLASPHREAAVPGTYVVGAAVGAVVANGTERVARDGSRHDGRPPPPPPSPTSHRERLRPRPLPAEAPS